MSDSEWALVASLLPPPGNTVGKGGRPEKHPRRVVLDAIFYVARGGIAWRQTPGDFPPAMTIYDIFRRWAKTVVWQQVHDALRNLVRLHTGRDPLPTAAKPWAWFHGEEQPADNTSTPVHSGRAKPIWRSMRRR
ncbi:transposase [Nocardia sp. NPDC049190]|uniref:transposase n=1 Tax=unclassified Nocardia TaxID=2637762 RepID=UPI0033DEF6A7